MLTDIENNPRKTNWALNVKNMLCNYGFQEVWIAQGVGHTTTFISIFQRRVKDTFIQQWYSRLENSTRASFYRVFANFELQAYLKFVNINKYKVALTKLRLSSHRLCFETGRWTNIPRENRLCTACNKLEDEFHLLFECQLYNSIRCKYIKK